MLENGKYGEYTDLYDENKNLTGEKLFRKKGTKLIVPKGRYSVVVLAFIENSKGEFLFQMTSKRKKNVWATTGGHVKSGQTSKEAIIEEIKEELGIDIVPIVLEDPCGKETAPIAPYLCSALSLF